MKNKIEVLIPKLIDERSLRTLARDLKKPNKAMNLYEKQMEERAYESCKRETIIRLHKRLYWRSNRPKWPLIIGSECCNEIRRKKVLKKVRKDLIKSGYITQFVYMKHTNVKQLNLIILGIK